MPYTNNIGTNAKAAQKTLIKLTPNVTNMNDPLNRSRLQGRLVVRGINITLFNIFVVSFTRKASPCILSQDVTEVHSIQLGSNLNRDRIRTDFRYPRTCVVRHPKQIHLDYFFKNIFFITKKMHFFHFSARVKKLLLRVCCQIFVH